MRAGEKEGTAPEEEPDKSSEVADFVSTVESPKKLPFALPEEGHRYGFSLSAHRETPTWSLPGDRSQILRVRF